LNDSVPARTLLPLERRARRSERRVPARFSPEHMAGPGQSKFDVIIIGSGFGGCMAALPLVEAGLRVLMLERGSWVERGPHNWGAEGAFVLTSHYVTRSGFRVRTPLGWRPQGLCTGVGGASVFYGGASFRFREEDFTPAPEIVGDSGARWPIDYASLEPHYARAEMLLGVAGEQGEDPTEPFRSGAYPHPPSRLAGPARRVADAARALGLHPFRIPLAIDAAGCLSCTTCDAFACAVSAKNDLATRLVPLLQSHGMVLRTDAHVVRLVEQRGRIMAIRVWDQRARRISSLAAPAVILAAGALATPQLLLASGLAERNPGGQVVGRYLMRHCNAMTYGFFPGGVNPAGEHHKQIAIHDFYFGDERARGLGKLGNIQQVMTPPVTLIQAMLPSPAGFAAAPLIANMTGLLSIAEDQPRPENGIELDPRARDSGGMPGVRIRHAYSRRDRAARSALVRRAKEILIAAGARFTVTWKVATFSHAVGTVRMGEDPANSALDERCRFRGIENLWVTDGSVFPTSGGVNPSLTIAANALRVGTLLAEGASSGRGLAA
jgi:choline dehydrogenase-like flavoprotein